MICVPSTPTIVDIVKLAGLVIAAAAWSVAALTLSHRRGYFARVLGFVSGLPGKQAHPEPLMS